MQSLNSVGDALTLDREKVESLAPGMFVGYNATRQKSSHVELAPSGGVIRKEKKRAPEKALYEFFSLKLWSDLFDEYSRINDLTFRAPKPIGVSHLDQEDPILYMEFLPGYEIKRLGNMRRSLPVPIKGQKTPLPLYPACALHLGALNRLKEEEGLFHQDYAVRHVFFNPVGSVYVGVIDVENGRYESQDLVRQESEKLMTAFEKHTSSPQDLAALRSWYREGQEMLKIPETSGRMDALIGRINRQYNVDFDPKNMTLNSYRVRSHSQPHSSSDSTSSSPYI